MEPDSDDEPNSFLCDLAIEISKNKDSVNLQQINDVVTNNSLSYFDVKSVSDFENLAKVVSSICSHGLVKDFADKDDRDYDARDFPSVADFAIESFKCLLNLFDKLKIESHDLKSLHSTLLPCLLLCGTHCSSFFWSNEESVSLSAELLQKLLALTKVQNVMTLLCEGKKTSTLFKRALLFLRPKLAKETWTQNPSSCKIFEWLFLNVKHPYLNDYLSDVLPPSLMFIDHYHNRNKVLGVQCLSHIIDNIPPSELKLYGRADVVYDALFHLTYLREVEIVQVVYPCILKLLSGQERSLDSANQARTWGRYDEVYQKLLLNMEMEDKIKARRVFSSLACLFIDRLGITVLKHFKKTKRILLDYLSVFDGPEEESRINTLKAFSILIKVAWPRMEYHCEDILQSITFLLYDIETESATNDPYAKESLLMSCKKCILLLKSACPETFQKCLSSLDSIEEEIPGVAVLRSMCEEELVVE